MLHRLAWCLPVGLVLACTGDTPLPPCTQGGDCASGACEAGVCVDPPTCTDGRKNGDESDLDCGGSCAAGGGSTCATGKACTNGDDCQSGQCEAKVCAPVLCKNGRLDPGESDVDCGQACGPCANGKKCQAASDCTSLSCDATVCGIPDCTNGVQDGRETGNDCGGPCTDTPRPAECKNTCKACEVGSACTLPRDCASRRCINNTCAP
ncbi:MAG: hypothetical protein IPF92_13285 [Myxococcales bacterium]|nr:hypothetical protein [Myxococcales bacterium]HQY61515.1 hypothetical protein [Polyangiaceae bacterium]